MRAFYYKNTVKAWVFLTLRAYWPLPLADLARLAHDPRNRFTRYYIPRRIEKWRRWGLVKFGDEFYNTYMITAHGLDWLDKANQWFTSCPVGVIPSTI